MSNFSPKSTLCLLFFITFFILFLNKPLLKGDEVEAYPYNYRLEAPRVILSNVPFTVTIQAEGAPPGVVIPFTLSFSREGVLIRGELKGPHPYESEEIRLSDSGRVQLTLQVGKQEIVRQNRVIPGILSILPPLLAIVFALSFREVIVALFSGVWLGALFLYDFRPFAAFLRVVDHYYLQAMTDRTHALIIMFSLILGGMVGVVYRSGGMHGVVEKISKVAHTPRSGQIVARIVGVLIFFDDYSNTLIVGNTMRPFTDKLRISREKLSYIVDSSAACIASIAVISTWIGFELSLISDGFAAMGVSRNAYITFLQTIPSRFYPIFTFIFGFAAAIMVRDFGSMYKAERRCRTTGQVIAPYAVPIADPETTLTPPPEEAPRRWVNAVVPFAAVIAITFSGLYLTGLSNLKAEKGAAYVRSAPGYEIFGAGDSFEVLLWAFTIGSVLAIVMAMSQRILNLRRSLEGWVQGIRSMIMACIILLSAWAIGGICEELGTANYVVEVSRSILSPHLIPMVSFMLSCAIAFATGTSWGTMAILMPIVIPLGYKMPLAAGLSPAISESVLLGSIAGVLAGAAFGDHCSPISDTTILSSMASGSDHIDHVKTQIPYAFTVGVVSALIGYLPMGYGISPLITVPIGGILLILILRFIGKKTDTF